MTRAAGRASVVTLLGMASTYLASRHGGPWAAAIVSGLGFTLVASSRSRLISELRGSADRLARLALVDDRTGLDNDRSFRAALQSESTGADAPGPSLTLVLADVDRFKEFNDAFGHPAGDAALRTFGQVLVASVGERTPVYRLGGDEFAVLLRDVDAAAGLEFAARLRAAVEGHAWNVRPITASLGVSTIERPGRVGDPSALFERADRALYRAKGEGGNTVVAGGAGGNSSPA